MSGNCILIDFNNLCYRMLFTRDIGVNVPGAIPNFTLWRFMVYDAIDQLMKRFSDTDEVVLAVDDKNPWRKSYFKRYKESRKKRREKQTHINWEVVFGVLHKYQGELKHHFPFKVIRIRSAEADDIIATIAMQQEKNYIISSNDEDFLQLCSDKVQIWNPSKKKFMVEKNPSEFLKRKCLMGQPKDDIFNVITPNDWGQTEETMGKRKPGFGDKSADNVMKEGVETWLEKKGQYKKFDTVVDVEKNYYRNRVLIDFVRIPRTIRNRVLYEYYNYNFPPPQNILPFFKRYKMRGFIDEFPRVERSLMKLYV